MPRPIEHFWRILPAVRRTERERALFFIGLLALVTAAQTVGLAGTEALFLARLSARSLPLAFVCAATAAVLGSAIYAVAVGLTRNDSLFAWMLLGPGVLLLVVPFAAPEPGTVLLFALIAAYYLTQCVLINHFWTFASDYFDTLTSKRLIPVFAIGSSVGGLAGGGLGALTAQELSPVATIAVWGGLLLGASAMLRIARRPLRRWGPLGAEEADETSVEGMAAAVRFVRQSRLGRWLLLASLGMVIAQFIAQYIYSDVFVRSYPDPTELAVFIAVYLALSNIVEIALVLWGTPWLIRRFGIVGANVVHPGLTLASFAALLASVRLDTSVGARAVRELVENAVAQPTRALVFNALPPRFRGRIRAFLEGVVVYGGMAAAGVLLLALETPNLRALALVGGGAALAYVVANLGVRRAYLDALIEGIRTGRLDLGDLDEEIGAWDAASLAGLCDELLRAETVRPSRSLLQLIASLGQHGVTEPLARGLSHPLASVRIACVRALSGCRDAHDVLRGALADADAEVRLAALAALPDDPNPLVRAAAAARSPATSDHLVRMLERGDRAERFAALAVAGEVHAALIARTVGDDDPLLGGAALERLAAVAPDRVPAGAIERALDAADPRVRCAALRAWSGGPELAPRERIARALRDPAPEVRSCAAEALATAGTAGVEAALPYLGDASATTAGAALAAIAAGDHPHRRRFLAPARGPGLARAGRAGLLPGRRSRDPIPAPGGRRRMAARAPTLVPDARGAREPARRPARRARAALRRHALARRRARSALEPRRSRRRATARAHVRAGPDRGAHGRPRLRRGAAP